MIMAIFHESGKKKEKKKRKKDYKPREEKRELLFQYC